jgi:transcriptional regulator with XRE-family HTH domain
MLLGIDKRQLAQLSGLSVAIVQRLENSEAMVEGNAAAQLKLIEALQAAGIELIDDGMASQARGRGVRLTQDARSDPAPSGVSRIPR